MWRLEKALEQIRVILSGPAPEHVSPGGLRPKPKNLVTSESLGQKKQRYPGKPPKANLRWDPRTHRWKKPPEPKAKPQSPFGKPVAFLTEEEESVLKEPIESPRKIDARKSRCSKC